MKNQKKHYDFYTEAYSKACVADEGSSETTFALEDQTEVKALCKIVDNIFEWQLDWIEENYRKCIDQVSIPEVDLEIERNEVEEIEEVSKDRILQQTDLDKKEARKRKAWEQDIKKKLSSECRVWVSRKWKLEKISEEVEQDTLKCPADSDSADEDESSDICRTNVYYASQEFLTKTILFDKEKMHCGVNDYIEHKKDVSNINTCKRLDHIKHDITKKKLFENGEYDFKGCVSNFTCKRAQSTFREFYQRMLHHCNSLKRKVKYLKKQNSEILTCDPKDDAMIKIKGDIKKDISEHLAEVEKTLKDYKTKYAEQMKNIDSIDKDNNTCLKEYHSTMREHKDKEQEEKMKELKIAKETFEQCRMGNEIKKLEEMKKMYELHMKE